MKLAVFSWRDEVTIEENTSGWCSSDTASISAIYTT